jgi:integrase
MTGITDIKADKSYEICMKDENFTNWYNTLYAQKKNTALAYKNGVILFSKHCNKTPKKLIEEARKDYEKRVPPWEHKHIQQIESFIHYMMTLDSEKSNNTKLLRLKAIKHFYEFYKIPVNGIKHKITNTVKESYLDIPVLKLEDVRKAIHATGTKKMLRALILALLSSGQGQAEIRALKGKHLKNIVQGVAIVDMTRGKTNRRYTFFIGSEAIEAIREYKPQIKDDEFVFTRKDDEKPLTPQEFDGHLHRLCDKIGLNRAYFAPHRFRHFFKSTMSGNMDSTFIEFILGHKLPGVESSYFKGNTDKMLEQYLKNIHLLTAFEEKEVLQKELDALKTKDRLENEMLKAKVESTQRDMEDFKKTVREDLVRTMKLLNIGDFDSIAIDNLRVVKKARQQAESS